MLKLSEKIIQYPLPGKRILAFRGDTQTFSFRLPEAEKGSAWLRTNIGHGEIKKDEIIREVTHDETRMNRDWFDIPMVLRDPGKFEITIALCEVGHFDAKCYFLPAGKTDPVWPAGDNTTINVEPADTCCANIIYNAFVRQFGPNKEGRQEHSAAVKEAIEILDNDGYTVIPPSGTFRDLIKELDLIVGDLGCRVIQLLPVHPTPTTYARMGRFGSPYAALSFTAVDPALAEFDPKATPTEQFIELVDAIHGRNAKVILDIAINHTGWAARLHNTHPEWLARDKDGRIEAPGAWGVVWKDLAKLDYSHKELWQHMAEVFLLWCSRGVDGFRCDAGYMIPVPAWKYITAVVRKQFPDSVFLLEGLGSGISVSRDILNNANLNWAYSELFQNYDRAQIENYLQEPIVIAREDGIMIHFAETHDNLRLAERSEVYARMRTALSALCSQHGGFGFTNGVEWFATERIDVHRANSLNWGAENNQVHLIHRLSLLLKTHPAFHDRVELSMIQQGKGNFIILLRHHVPSGKRLLVAANLDVEGRTRGKWDPHMTEMGGRVFWDLITEQEIRVPKSKGMETILLEPGQVFCLTADRNDLHLLSDFSEKRSAIPDRITKQCFRAKAMDVHRFYNGTCHLGDFDPDKAAGELETDPLEFCRSLNVSSEESRVITWRWPHDIKREVMIPPGHFLLVKAETPFSATIVEKAHKKNVLAFENSLPFADGSHAVLFLPLPFTTEQHPLNLKLSVYNEGHCEHAAGHLLSLPMAEQVRIKRCFFRSELLRKSLLLLGTNGRGGMLRAHVSWGKLAGKYDALLAANLNPDYPEDRWIMFSRCRAWLVFQGYSTEVNDDSLDSFSYDDNYCGYWRYHVPFGQGQYVFVTIAMEMAPGENGVRISFFRHKKGEEHSRLPDSKDVRIILRPDIEDRNFHEITKAFLGPEHVWPDSVTANGKGFVFAPDVHRVMRVQISKGEFILEPEWYYNLHRPMEAERGLDADSDLFSPGYFNASLKGGETVNLVAQVRRSKEPGDIDWRPLSQDMVDHVSEVNEGVKLTDALVQAMDSFVVRRNALNTVIAGYPWFLDWGRDTLILVRGLITAARTDTARAVLEQFARFEENGTIPNTIRGEDAGNRDTSDAPLWFFVACSDLTHAERNESFLDTGCGDRTIRRILISMARSMISGTPNGIRMDPESGLIFSPAHFTWMDTNHPAGTPREGYPIEIQALWHFALSFLARIDGAENKDFWQKQAYLVKESIKDLFMLKSEGYLSDCLHASPGEPAGHADPDDALRPNQLLAVTLGAVTDKKICRKIVTACEELLVPGAIRSLADRKVRYPLPIVHHGNALNDPTHPYQGRYAGDEDTRRKPAYHNGTAWTWVFPFFSEAWVRAYGEEGKAAALAWLASGCTHINYGCTGHVPEILDGDFPHSQRGCDAQAWGASELFRVWVAISG